MSDLEFQKEDKRELRRKRRVRNQIFAYVSLVLILILVGVGAFFAVKTGSNVLAERKQQKLEEALAQMEDAMTQASEEEIEPEKLIEEETTTIEEYTDEELLDEIVEACISEMSLEDKVAGLFIVTPEALTGVDKAVMAGDGTKEALENHGIDVPTELTQALGEHGKRRDKSKS